MSLSSLLDAAIGTLLAMHPPQPYGDPPVQRPDPVPGLSDDELAKLADASAEETIEVTGDAPAESSSSVHLDRSELRYRLRTQPSDILRQVPGLVVSQHAGGGKSDQYFIRGFDADHGTDIAIFADGVPVNLPSHGHGQGYADTHWMIPETIDGVDMHKGPYAARYGDFYTAGALELHTLDEIEGPTVWVASGAPLASGMALQSYDRRLVGLASPHLRDGDKTLLALQIADTEGPFQNPQDFKQGNALAKWRGKVGPGELFAAGTWYHGTWNQSGQLPESAVADGIVDRFGSLDPSEGGIATRASLAAGYRIHDGRATWRIQGYGVRNQLDLFSNFTLFARDPMNGDQIEQTDDRWVYGADAAYERAFGDDHGLQGYITTGAQVRVDSVETGLYHTAKRDRLGTCFAVANPCNDTQNHIANLAAYSEADLLPIAWLHVRPAVRVDRFTWDVTDLDASTARDPMTTTGGNASKAIVSPKLSLEAHADDTTSFFLNGGTGFHSNDARSAVRDGDQALARAVGGEFGVRMKPAAAARVSADVWYLHLSSEQVWSGDTGGTEPSAPTRRFGLDVEGSVDANAWLRVDGNVTWAHSTFVGNAGNNGALALAPRWMGSGGVAAHDKHGFVSLRTRGIADRPGTDDGTLTAKGYLLFDAVAGTKLRSFDVTVSIANLLNTDWREAQFAETSRITPAGPLVEQMHFTPGIPLTATVAIAGRL